MKKTLTIFIVAIFLILAMAFFVFGEGDYFFYSSSSGITPGSSPILGNVTVTGTMNGTTILLEKNTDAPYLALLSYRSGLGTVISGWKANGTKSNPLPVNDGDSFLQLGGTGYGSTGFLQANSAEIWFDAAGTWTDTSNPSRLGFYTAAVGQTSLNHTRKLVIDSTGKIGMNLGFGLPYAYLQVYGVRSDPSLLITAESIAAFSDDYATLALTSQTADPYTFSMQARSTTGNNTAVPIAINPLGGNVIIPNLVATGGTISGVAMTTSTIAFTDTQVWTPDAGIPSINGGPSPMTRIQGNIGNGLTTTPSNSTAPFGTFTVSGQNVTAAVSSGAANALLTITGLAVGGEYHLSLTPTLTSGAVPNITNVSGITVSNIPVLLTATQGNIYFQASATTAVFQINVSGASNFALASVATYDYTKPIYGSDFLPAAIASLLFPWVPPGDWDGGNVTIKFQDVLDSSNAITTNQTVVRQISGLCIPTGANLDQIFGTGVNAAYTAGSNLVQYSNIFSGAANVQFNMIGGASGTNTICYVKVAGGVGQTYGSSSALTAIKMMFKRIIQ